MRIATWNVNSIRQRQGHLLTYLTEAEPDVLCLQELKATEEGVPVREIEQAGYAVAVSGQKSWNGVAILSRHGFGEVVKGLPGDTDDEQARYIEATIPVPGQRLRVASIYLPNGNPVNTDKFAYKLAWMDRLIAHARALLAREELLVLAGDYNVIPDERDAADPDAWIGDALFRPETRARFRQLEALGLTDALRACDDAGGRYTFWDYQAAAWQRNFGIRIDHLLLSPQAADRLAGTIIHKHVRGWEKPSDHVPIAADLRIDVPAP